VLKPTHTTAIIIFANSSQKESQHKAIVGGEKLFSYFNAQILEKVQKTGLPYFIYSEKEQHGTTFGTRFSNAIADVFSKGFTQIITVGNDTPSLEAKDILKAQHDVQKNNVVFGPATDGGIYLLGIHKENFNAANFQNLPWQTQNLRVAFQQSLDKENVHVQQLRTLKDIDQQQDVIWFYKRLSQLSETFKNILLTIVQTVQSLCTQFVFYKNNFFTKLPYNKGSPLLH